LDDWLSGAEKPTLRQLEDLAKAVGVPFGYFFLPEPPKEELPLPYFRTIEQSTPAAFSPELVETLYLMQRRQGWMREYLIERGHAPLPFVGSAQPSSSPKR
jgi:transcriptional regulator with XRE-family HTH domain